MFKLNYYTLQQLVEKKMVMYVFICGDKYQIFIGNGNMLYYRNSYDGTICKLKLADDYEICLE